MQIQIFKKLRNYFEKNLKFRPPEKFTPQTTLEQPMPLPNVQKELWIFWYSAEEPKLIEQFRARRGANSEFLKKTKK